MYNSLMPARERDFRGNKDPQTMRELKKGGFICAQCRAFVPINDEMGTANRNHCPLCLWSKHLDNKPGDRRSDCLARMKPMCLTFKMARRDKYGNKGIGELMLAHICTRCSKISINRIAADDNTESIMNLFEQSQSMATDLRETLGNQQIRILGPSDLPEINAQLYGRRQ